MSAPKLVGIAGSFNRPSKTYSLVRTVADLASQRYGFANKVYDLHDVGVSLGAAQSRKDLDEQAKGVIDEIVSADVLIVGSPTFKGSYPGLGGDRHALMVEHQLRPLFGFFMAHTLPTAVYASDRDFTDYKVSSEPLSHRINEVVGELAAFFPHSVTVLAAAE